MTQAAQQQYNIAFDMNVLIQFVTNRLNQDPDNYDPQRGVNVDKVRAAISQGLKDYADSIGEGTEIKVDGAWFEMVAGHFVRLLEEYKRERAEKKAIPVGHGVYADVVDDDAYAEAVKRAGLK